MPIFWLAEGYQTPASPFAVILIEGQKEQVVSFGGGRGRNGWLVYGQVLGMFFVPINGPQALAQDMRDEFCGILRGLRFDGVSVFGVSPIGGGNGADKGKHFSLQALAEFEYRFNG